MKRIVIIISLMCVFSFAKSQDEPKDFNKHEVMTGVGYFGLDGILVKWTLFFNQIGQAFLQYYEISNFKRYGDFHVSYKYKPIERVMIGGTFIYTGTKSEVFHRIGYGLNLPSMKMGVLRYDFYTIAAELNALYVNTTNFKLYGNFGLGFTFGVISYTTIEKERNAKRWNHINYQIAPIGFRFGNNIGGFFELGYGYKGIFNGGMFVNF
jgi:hypothetical protein